MKNIFALCFAFALVISCNKKETSAVENKTDSTKIVDSINAARTKINDSIKSENRFKSLSGNHRFSFQSQNSKAISGMVKFEKIGGERDNYNIEGSINSGSNSVKIKGFAQAVSDRHINFTGEIIQKISGDKPYTRKGTKTFLSKDGGKTYRLQDMVNGAGFVDYIDIHF
ncbi:hypothetical protein ASG01_08255 [Chryseobacterium sp. Leaf180]|jgi:hypothetical protein|uniref:hypothetical protein n=1 Tax=Chryseobacterium sp. Leaf180 TaxID=1736289 RepID=UPI0006F7E02B|nr:hypothetical protein [Chryseobacterium sp. Leaf180]KQR93842.1 hypothetical protein ASG01_08255 [Chryseobacterium sp. Leaf180]